jgi:hypothetical protein
VVVPLPAAELGAVRSPDDFDGAFAAVPTAWAEGLVMLGSPVLSQHAPQLAALTAHHRLPAIYPDRRFAEVGGLMAYGQFLPVVRLRSVQIIGSRVRRESQ